ncbi:MAG: bacterial Ig-like domain-containing protein, partial [Roseburia sp.]
VKTSYTAGDTLNVDDLTVTAYYEDSYSEAVTGYTTNVSDIDMSTIGEKTLTISYTKNGGTKAKDIAITVNAVPVTEYTITSTAGANGSISPGGAVRVAAGGSQTFMISPSSGYVIDTLKVDGMEVTATTSYTFSDVNSNHTIEVTFKQESQTPDVPDVTAPSITTQPGNATVKVGETATFTLAASGTALTYQWQIDRNDGNGWVNIAGANEASYTTSTVNISCNGFKYQCVVSNSAGTVTSNTAVLTVTENIIPDPDPVDYEILDGANSNWEQNSDGSLSIRGSGALSKFVGVKVDGTLVDAKNYTVKEGSTIVTLKADYLNTLSVGSHTIEIVWTDGLASTNFTIKADNSDNGNNNQNDSDNNNSNTGDIVLPDDSDKKEEAPKTGDDTPSVWLFILTIISGTGLILTAKKRRKNLKMSEK